MASVEVEITASPIPDDKSKQKSSHHDDASYDSIRKAIGEGQVPDNYYAFYDCRPNISRQRSISSRSSMTKCRVISNSILYCTGSILFIIGSFFYYPFANQDPNLDGFTIGAIFYLIGASLFLIATLVDWLILQWRRPGFVLDYSVLYILGSAEYVIGCIYYIPVLNSANTGSYLFISGSLFFIVPAIYEIQRNIKTNDKSSLIPLQMATAIHTAIGALLFLIGAVLFLGINNNDDLILATTVFVSGSMLFAISSVLVSLDLYRKEWPETSKMESNDC